MPEFCHLHCHTQYSLLDGAARIKRLIQRADRMNLSAVAITDHGNLYGVPEFYHTAQQHGVQPIIGCEFYVTPSGIQDRSDATRYHQVLLAKNERGYRNLMALSSKSFIDGFYYKPRIDHKLLRQHSEGLIATTCCLQGEVLQTILKKGEAAARPIFEAYLDIFGDDYYVEIQAHGIDDQDRCNEVLLRWAKEYGVKTVATNDVHYVDEADADAQDVLLCLQTGKDYHAPDRMRFENDQFFLKGVAEMQEALSDLDPTVRDAALDHTREIADKCRFELPMPDLLMPHYPVPERFGGDMDAYLQHMVFQRAEERYGEMTQAVTDRLEREMGIIKQMGYAGYFLIVQDFTTAARELDVRVGPGRGSAAGSAVAYCLGITNVDPLKYDLLFERFLNPHRKSMPDIDIDFDDRGRAKVIDYVVQKYGRENVCQIITFGTMGAKTVLRDVSRVLGVPLSRADEIAKMIPDGVGVDLDQALKEVPEFRQLKGSDDPKIRQLMQYAEVLEGSARHTGVHAAGVIIAPGKVSDYVPVSISKSKGEKVITTQYDGDWVEKFGLLKMDFLGLKTLTVVGDALALIEQNHGTRIDLDEIPLDDEATFRLFQQGDTVSIFQFESTGMREWMRKLRPTEIGDLIAMNALYRPGPMDLIPDYIARKHGKEEVSYPHPSLEAVLKPTYGIPVFQEQVMKMAQVMAGYSLGQADILRRCVTGDTLVVDADTGARIRVDDVEPGTRLQTLDANHRLQTAPVQETFDNGTKPVYRVRTRSGRTIKLTAEHPLLTVSGWQHLCDLAVGDFIAVPSMLPVVGTASPDPARVKVLAYLLGDGCTRRKGGYAQAFFYNSDPEVLRDYQDAAGALGAKTRTYTHKDIGVTTVTARGADGETNPLHALIRETGLDRLAHEKRVPDEVFGYDEAALQYFLGCLWTTDGSVERTRLSYSSSNLDLVDDVAHLLLRLGIVSMRRARQTTHHDNFELVITDQRDVLRFAEVVGPHLCTKKEERLHRLTDDVSGRGRNQSVYNIPAEVGHLVKTAKMQSGLSWRAAGERIGVQGNTLSSGLNLRMPRRTLSRHRIQALGEAFSSTALTNLAQGDVLWDPIVEITLLGEERVYDLSVPPHANFVAADVVIHNSMGKKKQSIMDKQRVIFVEGAAERGIGEAKANEVFDMMAKFAGYGFNKSHSAAYSLVAYQTAYLKAHYPAEFMAAAMTNEMGDTKKLTPVLDEARKMDLELLPPCVNHSAAHFTVDDGQIRFGMGAIKGAGLGAIEALVEARAEHGPFSTIYGLTKDLDLRTTGKRMLEALGRAGALDALEGHRAQLVEAVDTAVRYGQKVQMDRAAGQNSLFGGGTIGAASMEPALPEAERWSRAQALKEERAVIGFYVSGHPLESFRPEADAFATAELSEVERFEKAQNAHVGGDGYGRNRGPTETFCGILTDVKRHTTKSGKPIAFAALEDFTGQGELVCFASVLDRIQNYLTVDEVVLVKGTVEVRGGAVKIIVQDVIPMWKVREQMVKALILRVEPDRIEATQIKELRALCEAHPGRCKLYFDILAPGAPQAHRVRSRTCVVDPTAELMNGIRRLLGPQSIALRQDL